MHATPLVLVSCSHCGRLHEPRAAMDAAHPICGDCLTHPPLARSASRRIPRPLGR